MKTALSVETVDCREAFDCDHLRSQAEQLRAELYTTPFDCTAVGRHRTSVLRTAILETESRLDALENTMLMLSLAA